MLFVILCAPFIVALFIPWLSKKSRRSADILAVTVPLGLFSYCATLIPQIQSGSHFVSSMTWAPLLGLRLSLTLDGLSLLFALLITGIGALILLYTGKYRSHQPRQGEFLAFMFLFMGSMLGVVLADNVIALYVFWELTGLSSYLLIGFNHEDKEARAAALQALLITSGGGLILLAGLILLSKAGGSFELSVLTERENLIRAHDLFIPIFICIIIGAFTKSAQAPFYTWLPKAMAAPTPVSAYLHSAAMVKTGIYLLARTENILGGTGPWLWTLVITGGTTALITGWMSLTQSDMKKMLAYSTSSALGLMVVMLGLGDHNAIVAAVAYLTAHALYKSTLFMSAGIIDHVTGTRDITRLNGLWRTMPLVALASFVAAVSTSGIPPSIGFIGKGEIYRAGFTGPQEAVLVSIIASCSMTLTAVAWMTGIRPYWRGMRGQIKMPREIVDLRFSIGPLLLGAASIFFGLFPQSIGRLIFEPAASIIAGEPISWHWQRWHGFTLYELVSLAAIGGGFLLFLSRRRLRLVAAQLRPVTRWGPQAWYAGAIRAIFAIAKIQTQVFQNRSLQFYLTIIFTAAFGVAGFTIINGSHTCWPGGVLDVQPYEVILVLLTIITAIGVAGAKSLLGAIVMLGALGYEVSLIFMDFGAPDVAITQILTDTLMVFFVVLAAGHLPDYQSLSSTATRLKDGLLSLAAGGVITSLILVAIDIQMPRSVSDYFMSLKPSERHGDNIVMVILADCRVFDTLGEITVFLLSGLGVYSLLRKEHDSDRKG